MNEYGDLLRAWRKARALSQFKLAEFSGVSQRYLSFLETGKAHPTRAMVLCLSEYLGVARLETNRMLLAAGHAPLPQLETGIRQDEEGLRTALKALLDAINPVPCVVVDRAWDMVDHNAGFERLIGLFVDPETVWSDMAKGKPRNLARLFYHKDGLCSYVANGSLIGRQTIFRLLREQLVQPNDDALSELLRELLESPLMPDDWRDMLQKKTGLSDAGLPQSYELQMQGDMGLLRFAVLLATTGTELDLSEASFRQVTFLPLDEKSHQSIQL